MKRPLKETFPANNNEAEKYGGFMYYDTCFCKIFNFNDTFENVLKTINIFLKKNDYQEVEINKFDEEYYFENDILSISKHGYQEELVLFINKNKSTI